MKKLLKREHASDMSVEKGYLTGKLLVATPFLFDSRFFHSVIYVCGHDTSGAIGLVVNRLLPSISFEELLRQIDILDFQKNITNVPIYYGGPIEMGRGFVLHTNDYQSNSTVPIDDSFSVTATLDIIKAIAQGSGPTKFLLTLGYTGWVSGQLEQEIMDNSWLSIDPSTSLIFDMPIDDKWRGSMASIGVDPAILSMESGHA